MDIIQMWGLIFETKDIYWLLKGFLHEFGGDYGCVG